MYSKFTKTAKGGKHRGKAKMSAKIIFDTKAEIPAHLQSEAVEVDGKFELGADGVLNKNRELLGKQKTDSQTIETLTAEKANAEHERDEAKAKGIPAGHRAVSIEIAELGQAAKAEGFTKETLPETKTKIETFEREKTEQLNRATKSKALKIAGVTDEDAFFNMKQADALDFEFESVDGKEKAFAVKDENGVKTKFEFNHDYLSKADGFKNIIPVLFAAEEKRYIGQESGAGGENNSSVAASFINSTFRPAEKQAA